MAVDPSARETVSFGPFRLIASERLLLKEEVPVALGSRSLDILIALVERPGAVVNRSDLIKRVWPDVIVEESSLRVHIANLRKALGDGREGARYIANLPGRGYCFVAAIERIAGAGQPDFQPGSQRLPRILTRMVGREWTVAAVCSLCAKHRFVSIVGAGGMGKTTVAIAAAHALLDSFQEAVYFVDLGAMSDEALLSGALGAALGCVIRARDPVSAVLAFLADKRALLVFDNCEHMVGAVAKLAERLFAQAPFLHILTTSREALRVEGEHVHLLQPLETPLDYQSISAAEALQWPAIKVFMERAVTSGYQRALTDAEAPVVAAMCRRLDGIPLAIELAGSQAGAYGIQGTADLIDHRFKLLWQGRRSALARHHTLRAMLDWSYNLLSAGEKKLLCQLSIFVGNFTLEGALAVAGPPGCGSLDVAGALSSLVDKSLVWTSDTGRPAHFRLPDTTRAYAAAKLAELGEDQAAAKCHAFYYAGLFQPDVTKLAAFGQQDKFSFTSHLNNIRAALEWCFSESGDIAIGIELITRSATLFIELLHLDECKQWCTRGMEVLPEEARGTRKELSLQVALAISSMFIKGRCDEVGSAIRRSLSLAQSTEDLQCQLHLLVIMHVFLVRIGDFRAALDVAERGAALARASSDTPGIIMAEWAICLTHHMMGDQAAALRHCEIGLDLAAMFNHTQFNFFGFDHHIRALVGLARILWLRGSAERALDTAGQAIELAVQRNCPVTLGISLAYTIPILLWAGDLAKAETWIEQQIAHVSRHSIAPFHALALAQKGELKILQGDVSTGVRLLRGALEALRAERHYALTSSLLRALAEGLARSGHFREANEAIEQALSEQAHETFDRPDILRTQADILLMNSAADSAAATALLLRSLDAARTQSALAWELRSATRLARLWMNAGNAAKARALLSEVYQKFTEGFETADLRAAAGLLAKLGQTSLLACRTREEQLAANI
jgi:predicted ATPase/DNA-binding winged helix-turn-helix (wHTH) protein